jgi:antitoxin CptB
MLELDVLLGNFLEEAYLSSSAVEQDIFVRLLSENDQDLFMWLTGKSDPEDQELAILVRKIRQHAQTRHTN